MDRPVVLVGIDFSDSSARALDEARRLADRMGAEVGVVHVRRDPPAEGWIPDEVEVRWLREAAVDPTTVRTRSGTPWVELSREATESDARLVVVGTHGSSGYHQVGLGTTAFRLALTSSRPVVLVGRRGAPSPSEVEARHEVTRHGPSLTRQHPGSPGSR